jgi:hypothetical protein
MTKTEPRCSGHGTDSAGHQIRMECVSCARRLAGVSEWSPRMDPPQGFPCPMHIREEVDV